MKKILAILMAMTMALSLAACGEKTQTQPEENTTEQQSTEPSSTSEFVEGDPAEYSMDYWAEKYPGENICPFTIEENGKEYNYYWVSGLEGWDGTMESWIKQPFNWNGWHKTADGCIVNKDETLKITDDWANGEGMSSSCTVTTEKYEGSTTNAD